MKFIGMPKGAGKTTFCFEYLKYNPNSVLICDNFQSRFMIEKYSKEIEGGLKDRIFYYSQVPKAFLGEDLRDKEIIIDNIDIFLNAYVLCSRAPIKFVTFTEEL
jgi:hypothetical protein